MKTIDELLRDYTSAAMAYYNGKPIMTDEEFDLLEKDILSIRPDFDIKTYCMNQLKGMTIDHHAHLPEYTKSSNESIDYENLADYGEFITPKYDGCSIIAYYKNGEPYQIATRSNDKQGKNQFDKLINKVLHNIDPKIEEIYYEATTNLNLGDRSRANGLINSKYLQNDVDKYLTLNPFGCYSSDKNVIRSFMKNYTHIITKDEMKFIIDNGQLYDGTPADGVVSFNVDNNTLRIRKIYANGSAKSKIISHSMTFSDTTLTQSVVNRIDQVKVDNATLRNVKMGPIATLKKLGLGLGAEVEVIRVKKVIPYISKVITPSNDFSDIKCTCCGNDLTEIGSDLICTNLDCELMNLKMISRIQNIGKKIEDLTCEELFSVIRIPRFNFEKINVPDDFNKMTLDEKLNFFNKYCSTLQSEYITIYGERLKYIINNYDNYEVIENV